MTQESPLVYLKLDAAIEGHVADSSGHGHRGALGGGATVAPDEVFGACLAVDQVGEVRVPDSPRLRLTHPMTVQAWVFLSHPAAGETHFVSKGQGVTRNYVLGYFADGRWMFQWSNYAGGSVGARAAQSPAIRLNAWYHVAGVRDTQQAALYVHDMDGALVATAFAPLGPGPSNEPSPLLVGLGHRGRVAHVRVYDVARNLSDIVADMSLDQAERRRIRDLPKLAKPQAALRFAVNEATPPQVLRTRVDIPPPNLRNGFTLEAFVKTYDTGPRATWPRRVVAAFNPPDGWVLSLDRGVLTFQIVVTETVPGPGGGAPSVTVRTLRESDESAAGWSAGEKAWNHVAVCIHPATGDEPARYVLYRNGRRVDIVVAGANPASAVSTGILWVGAMPDTGGAQVVSRFFGEISEIEIWYMPLLPRDIALHRLRRLAGDELGLLAYWPISAFDGGVFRNQVSNTGHLHPALTPDMIAPENTDQAYGARLMLIPPNEIVDPAVEMRRLIAETMYWRQETQRLLDNRNRLDRDTKSQQAIRESLETAAREADEAIETERTNGIQEQAGLATALAADLQQLEEKIRLRSWDFDEVIAAVDGQLREARATVPPDATHRLDSLSLNIKALPSADGAKLSFPDPKELGRLPPEVLSNVQFDFESRERFEASRPRRVKVPNVSGMTQALARRTLAGAGLIMEVAYSALPVDAARSDDAAEVERQVGTVRDQLPAPDVEINQNDRVTVYIGLRAQVP